MNAAIAAFALSSAPKPAAVAPAPVPAVQDGEIKGTRQDLADFLRKNRRSLKLRFFDRWGDPELPIHSFISLLDRAPFRESNGSRSCAMHFTIFPF